MPVSFKVKVEGEARLYGILKARAILSQVAVPKAILRSAQQLQNEARAIHRAGRPAPIVRTFQFHDAWTIAEGGWHAVMGNGSDYANRLEFGFVGTDSLGRHYAQPPYPSLGPAVDHVRPDFYDNVREALT
jgi:hypothetical protein